MAPNTPVCLQTRDPQGKKILLRIVPSVQAIGSLRIFYFLFSDSTLVDWMIFPHRWVWQERQFHIYLICCPGTLKTTFRLCSLDSRITGLRRFTTKFKDFFTTFTCRGFFPFVFMSRSTVKRSSDKHGIVVFRLVFYLKEPLKLIQKLIKRHFLVV